MQYVCLQKAIQKLTGVIRLFAESNTKADRCNTVVYKKQYKKLTGAIRLLASSNTKLAAVIQLFERKYKPENNDKSFCYSIQTLAPPTRRPVRNRRSGHSSATLRNRWLCQRTNRGKQYCGCVTVSFLILTFRHFVFYKNNL